MDTPMHRKLFVEMTQPEQEAFMASLQQRRLRMLHEYQRVQEERAKAAAERASKQMLTHWRIMERDVAAAERAMEKVEARLVKIAALRAMSEEGQDNE